MKEKEELAVICEGEIQIDLIPEWVGENLAQVGYKAILRAWQDPNIRVGYEQWKSEREAKAQNEDKG